MSVQSLLDSRMLLVTGKGGTGKTSFSAALAVLGAAKGKRTLLCEVDTQRPSMAAIFGHPPQTQPEQVMESLDLVNVHWDVALSGYLQRYLPSKRLVDRILKNKVVRRFLDFAPGGRELFILSRLVDLAADYDLMVIDMHASGHAFSMLDITRSAMGVFRSGPMLARAEQLVQAVRDPGDERTLIRRLAEAELDPLAREFVRAGFWEDSLEQATEEAQQRLAEAFPEPPVLVPPAGAGGVPRLVVGGIAVHLGRMVGVTRRELPWI